jgi:hypothetical protein
MADILLNDALITGIGDVFRIQAQCFCQFVMAIYLFDNLYFMVSSFRTYSTAKTRLRAICVDCT